ncbi:MAG: magnesium transporter CorA family protein [Planctomycetota bacterium]|nr:magnesium transporter CorA family protein [Planctomycetota bacterium]
MLRRLQIQDGRVVENGEGPVWIYVAPDETERKFLVETMRLDEHTLASSLDADELGRIEFEPDHAAIIFKRPRNYSSQDNFLFKVASTGLFLFKDRLVIVMAEDAPLFEGKRFLRLQSLPELVLKLVFRAIFHFEEHLKVINAISADLEQEVNTAMENKHLLNLFTLEKSLVYYLNAINTNGKVIDKLKASAPRLGFTIEDVELLDDIIIENSQCYEQASIYSQVLSGLMDARASIVSNNLNVLMKTLNIVMIALMLPTLVVSVFSMNVQLPVPQQGHLGPFWAIMAAGAASVAVVGWLWLRKKV